MAFFVAGYFSFMFNHILLVVMAAGLAIGGVDYFLGDRWKLGHQFEEGLRAFATLFIMMGGILVWLPLAKTSFLPVLAVLLEKIGVDPAVFTGMFIVCDTGGYFLAESLSDNPDSIAFGGMLLASVMGANVIFNLPVALGMVRKEDQADMALGFLYGFVTIPVGCLAGGVVAGIPFASILRMLWPVIIVSALLAFFLRVASRKLIFLFIIFGRLVNALAVMGIVVAMIASIFGMQSRLKLDTVDHCVSIILPIILVLPGAYVVVEIIRRFLGKWILQFGRRLHINEMSVLGLLASTANTILTFSMVKNMDHRGKILNFAFLSSVSFALADHLAFCTAVAPKLLLPMLVTKFTGAFAALFLAVVCTRNIPKT